MSIKSQKSLNEEFSEIFEKSYSIKSASEESLSCEDEDECLARELMRKMTPAVLSKLRRCFRKNKDRTHSRDIDRRVEEVMRLAAAEEGIEFATPSDRVEDTLYLGENAFVAALDNIFGHHKYTTHAHKLFQVLDPFSTGRVWWRTLIERLVAIGAKKTSSRVEAWTPVREKEMKKLSHCKRETIVKLVNIEREDSFCYAAVSKGGRVGVYSGEMRLVHSYEVFYHRTGLQRRVKNCWITDALYLTDVQCLILSASDRSLAVYDASILAHTPVYCITGIPNIPTCMAYSPSKQMSASELVFGTESGELTRIRFLQPRVSLFHTKSPDHINYYFWMELCSPPHSTYCSITRWNRVHSRSVRRVAYTRDGDIVVSCSHDAAVSVRVRHVPGKIDDYVFTVQRGVTCFHVVPTLHLLATGSSDGVVRLWETTQSSPYACLSATHAPLLDVAVVVAKEIVVGYCSNCMVYIWDMYEECLLQSFKIKFPILGALGKKIDFGANGIHPGPSRGKPEEQSTPDFPLESTSRRGSSVYLGSTGGLMLQPEEIPDNWLNRPLEQEPEYIRFNRSELVFTCCDYICILELSSSSDSTNDNGLILPPPADTLRARTPAGWDLPQDVAAPPAPLSRPPTPQRAPLPALAPPPPAHLLTTVSAEFPVHDLDELLENADLQGILEKDFVLMQGLKNDLNRKLAEMQANMETMRGAVSVGAPYLALKTHEPEPLEPVNEMTDTYNRVMRLFPGPSVAGTPIGSETPTPRSRRSGQSGASLTQARLSNKL